MNHRERSGLPFKSGKWPKEIYSSKPIGNDPARKVDSKNYCIAEAEKIEDVNFIIEACNNYIATKNVLKKVLKKLDKENISSKELTEAIDRLHKLINKYKY